MRIIIVNCKANILMSAYDQSVDATLLWLDCFISLFRLNYIICYGIQDYNYIITACVIYQKRAKAYRHITAASTCRHQVQRQLPCPWSCQVPASLCKLVSYIILHMVLSTLHMPHNALFHITHATYDIFHITNATYEIYQIYMLGLTFSASPISQFPLI